jgi:predicted small metal-binding protein
MPAPTAAPSERRNQMAKLINCQCGRTIRGETEEDVIRQAEEHIRDSHPELIGNVTREQLSEWVEDD